MIESQKGTLSVFSTNKPSSNCKGKGLTSTVFLGHPRFTRETFLRAGAALSSAEALALVSLVLPT